MADLVHHRVAGVDAQRAGDAFELLAVANVDACGADGDAGVAVDAIAGQQPLRLCLLLAAHARLAAPVIVGDDQRVLVEHGRLDARPGAHVDADLFAHDATKNIGGGRQDGDRGVGDERRLSGGEIVGQGGCVREIEDPGAAGGHRDDQPCRVLGQLLGDFRTGPGFLVEPDAGVAVALEKALDDQKQVGPDGLRAGVAAPGAADHRGDQEQANARHHQKAGDVDELLRPDLDEEEVEAPVGHVDQDSLVGRMRSAIPAQPGRDVVDAQRDRHDDPFQAAICAFGALGVDFLAGCVKRLRVLFRALVDGFNVKLFDGGLIQHTMPL